MQSVWRSESAVVWGELSEAIMRNEWEKASEEKEGVEEREKKMVRERGMKGESWVPKNFRVSYSKDTWEWVCLPIHKWVPPAPIIAP